MTNTPDKSEMKAWRDLAVRAIDCLHDVERETDWGQPTFGPSVWETFRDEMNALSSRPADQVPDMVERVARAISRATSVDLHGGKLTDYAADDWRDFEGEARAAIAALGKDASDVRSPGSSEGE